MDQETDKRRYLIFGHYGGSNTGDEAMVWCILERLARRGGGVVRLVTKGETVATGFPGVEAVSTSPLDLWRGALWCDELVLGGGTHFHDDYTPWRYLRHAAYMGRIVLLALLVKLRGRKFRLVGMGFGPFNGFTGKIPTALALRMADTVTTRDGASCQAARSCWKKAAVVEAFDLAALLEPDEVPDVDPDLVGISLAFSGTYALECADSEEWWEYFATELTEAAQEQGSVRFRIVVFRGGDREDDQRLSRRLHDRLEGALGAGRVEWCPFVADPRAMLSALAGCGSVIATRYHAALMGYASGCRLLFLPYHRKLNDLAEEIGLPPEACVEFRQRAAWSRLGPRLRAFLAGEDGFVSGLPVREARQLAEKNFFWLEEDEVDREEA